MGQIDLHHITLAEVVESSNLVVVATPAESREVSEPIDEATYDGESAPPFVWRRQEFVIEDVLFGEEVAKGETLAVEPADLDWDRDLHRSYFVSGISHSPVKRTYAPVAMADDEPRILFLSRNGGRIAFAVNGGMEGVDRIEEVRALIDARAPAIRALQRVSDLDALDRVRRWVNVYIGFSALFVPFFIGAFFVFRWPWLHAALAVTSAASTALMIVVQRRMAQRRHDMQRWFRLAIIAAVPGVPVAGLYGAFYLLLGVVTTIENSLNWARALAVFGGLVGTMGYILFLRITFKLARTDFSALLWEAESERHQLEGTLGYLESDDLSVD